LTGEETFKLNEAFVSYTSEFRDGGVAITLGKMTSEAEGLGGSDKYGKYLELGKINLPTDESDLGVLSTIEMKPFPLENIDKARTAILKKCELGDKIEITSSDIESDINFLPYSINAERKTNGELVSKFPMVGLCVKTYLSDIFNNWLNTEWIDGDDGINKITAISTADGSFTLDTLNLSQKIYNMLNRVAVNGGTFEDWQEAVYSEEPLRRAETPIYQGGASAEIVFEEVVSTAETNNGESKPLGTLAGKGTLANTKGGNITIKCDSV